MTSVRPAEGRAVLVTGAGGAAAVILIRSLLERGYRVVAADLDPLAVGLYLVPAESRVLLPRGDGPDFVPALVAAAEHHAVGLVVPTVDTELLPVARALRTFHERGVDVLVERVETLERCLDKLELVRACRPHVRVPTTVALDPSTTAAVLERVGTPFVVKPRRGAGGRGVAVHARWDDVAHLPRDGSYILQEHLPGTEYSIDVLARRDGHVVCAVPRTRDKVDSGIAVAGRTVLDEELMAYGRVAARTVGATGVVNVQVRRDAAGEVALLEVNPRFPGTMTLTVAAGVDMPGLAVGGAFGDTVPDTIAFREVAVVRHWQDVVVPVEEYSRVAATSPVAS